MFGRGQKQDGNEAVSEGKTECTWLGVDNLDVIEISVFFVTSQIFCINCINCINFPRRGASKQSIIMPLEFIDRGETHL